MASNWKEIYAFAILRHSVVSDILNFNITSVDFSVNIITAEAYKTLQKKGLLEINMAFNYRFQFQRVLLVAHVMQLTLVI